MPLVFTENRNNDDDDDDEFFDVLTSLPEPAVITQNRESAAAKELNTQDVETASSVLPYPEQLEPVPKSGLAALESPSSSSTSSLSPTVEVETCPTITTDIPEPLGRSLRQKKPPTKLADYVATLLHNPSPTVT